MNSSLKKPLLVFFQWKHDRLPGFLLSHINLHVKCLNQFFEVIVVNKDCDYRQVCEKYNPDLTLFESGYKSTISKRIEIKNTASYPHIPKVGLHNGDGWCECRVGFISDMERWGIDTFFTISVTTAEYTPNIAENIFVWPNFIDADTHHDYHQAKVIPVMVSGSMISLYPWRKKIYELISHNFPTLVFPHTGYDKDSRNMIYGEQYARTINSSLFVPACGTITNEIVRKHFEIPGCRSCLVTEQSSALIAAGFVDMKNCVFVDESNAIEKISYLLDNRAKLVEITDAGYELVQAEHTMKRRDQILQWFKLNKLKKDDEKIIQLGPFLPLKIVKKNSLLHSEHIYSNGLYLKELHRGSELLKLQDYRAAEVCFLKCLSYIPWMSEPKVKLAICCLLTGDAPQALSWIKQPIQNVVGEYEYPDPDPLEWTYYLIALICNGKLSEAVVMSNEFKFLKHDQLLWARSAVHYLNSNGRQRFDCKGLNFKSRASIHQLPNTTVEEWLLDVSSMLKKCNQVVYANLIAELQMRSTQIDGKYRPLEAVSTFKGLGFKIRIRITRMFNNIFENLKIPNRRTGLPSVHVKDFLIRIFRWIKRVNFE